MNFEEILPSGYRFNPTDVEIITYYLRPKVEGEDMTWFSSIISEEDLYGEAPPWVIFQNQQQQASSSSSSSSSRSIVGDGASEDPIRYFYTKLRKKHQSGEKYFHRMLGKNEEYCWVGQDKKDIYDDRTMTVIGTRKLFSLARSNQTKGDDGGANSNNNKKRKKSSSSSSKDHDEDDDDHIGNDKSFGNWIMHEYSLVNPPSTSSSEDDQNYVLCRIRMKAPPNPTTNITTTGNAATHDHNSINSTTAPPPVPSASTSSTAHDYQNMSYTQLLLHDHHQKQQDYIQAEAADHMAVPPLVPVGTYYQTIHDHSIEDEGYLLQPEYDHQLFQQDEQQRQQPVMYDQEQPAPMGVTLTSESEWEGCGLDKRGGGGGSSSHDQILDNNHINYHHDELPHEIELFVNMEVPLPVLLSNSMVDIDDQEQYCCSSNNDISSLFSNMSTMKIQEEGNHFMMNNGGGTSDHLDYSTSIAAGGVDNLDNGGVGTSDHLDYSTSIAAGGLDYFDNGGGGTSDHLDYSTSIAAGGIDNLDDGVGTSDNLDYSTSIAAGGLDYLDNGGGTSDHLDYSICIAAGGLDYLDNGGVGLANFDDDNQNSYNRIMNSLKDDLIPDDLW